jgi:hypothetical protein
VPTLAKSSRPSYPPRCAQSMPSDYQQFFLRQVRTDNCLAPYSSGLPLALRCCLVHILVTEWVTDNVISCLFKSNRNQYHTTNGYRFIQICYHRYPSVNRYHYHLRYISRTKRHLSVTFFGEIYSAWGRPNSMPVGRFFREPAGQPNKYIHVMRIQGISISYKPPRLKPIFESNWLETLRVNHAT